MNRVVPARATSWNRSRKTELRVFEPVAATVAGIEAFVLHCVHDPQQPMPRFISPHRLPQLSAYLVLLFATLACASTVPPLLAQMDGGSELFHECQRGNGQSCAKLAQASIAASGRDTPIEHTGVIARENLGLAIRSSVYLELARGARLRACSLGNEAACDQAALDWSRQQPSADLTQRHLAACLNRDKVQSCRLAADGLLKAASGEQNSQGASRLKDAERALNHGCDLEDLWSCRRLGERYIQTDAAFAHGARLLAPLCTEHRNVAACSILAWATKDFAGRERWLSAACVAGSNLACLQASRLRLAVNVSTEPLLSDTALNLCEGMETNAGLACQRSSHSGCDLSLLCRRLKEQTAERTAKLSPFEERCASGEKDACLYVALERPNDQTLEQACNVGNGLACTLAARTRLRQKMESKSAAKGAFAGRQGSPEWTQPELAAWERLDNLCSVGFVGYCEWLADFADRYGAPSRQSELRRRVCRIDPTQAGCQ